MLARRSVPSASPSCIRNPLLAKILLPSLDGGLRDNTGCHSGSGSGTRGPTLTLLGGGAASGKTSVISRLCQTRHRDWAPQRDALVVNADALKAHHSAVLRELGEEMHKRSTVGAEEMFVSLVNQGRDIVFDGTMAWEPFVRQTIQMVRHARQFRFKRGPGYIPEVHSKPGAPEETYWVAEGPQPESVQQLPPYRVRLIGVTVEPTIGVLRAMVRERETGRKVPVAALLRSYHLFSANFERYAKLVDDAILVDNNPHPMSHPYCEASDAGPTLCAAKYDTHDALEVLDQWGWKRFLALSHGQASPIFVRSSAKRMTTPTAY